MYYIFHGGDDHSQKKTLEELQAKLGDLSMLQLNTNHFDGKNLSFSELQHACDSIPFLADKRLIIVNDLLSNNPPYLEDLIIYISHLPETTRLVFVETKPLADSHPLVKLAEKSSHGYVKLFSRPEGSGLDRWIRERVKTAGGQIAPRAVHLLAINIGNDLTTLDNEIEKLILYKGQQTIEPDDVSLLCPYLAEASIFEMVDAIGSRHGRSAARLLKSKLDEGTDPFFLFGMLTRQFRLLIQVKELAGQGFSPQEMARDLNIHGFVATKLLQQSHNFTLPQLEQVYEHLLEVDVGVKTGKTDMTTSLCLLIAGISV